MQMNLTPADFRDDIFNLVTGSLVLAAGLISWGLFLLRGKRTDRSALYFGIASTLYGLRLFLQLNYLHALFPSSIWGILNWWITYVVGIPFVLGTFPLIANYPRLRRTVVGIQIAIAALGIPSVTFGYTFGQRVGTIANGVLGISLIFIVLYITFRPNRVVEYDGKVVRAGLLILSVSILFANLRSLGLPSTRLAEWEPIGFLVVLCCFGYASARRTLKMEQKLTGIESELEIAREIQSSLLPAADLSIPHLEVQARYLPMTSVAGDFYDILGFGQNVGALIADVSGHGVPAAISASMVKVALRAQAAHADEPGKVLAGINTALCGSLRDQFVTAAYVFIDAEKRELRYAGAGHPPLLLWLASERRVETLQENGLFFGPFPQAQYSEARSAFLPGDRCVLCTDGVLEAEDESGEEFGVERLRQFLAENADLSVSVWCDALLRRLNQWSGKGSERRDDITLLSIEYRR